MEIQIHQNTVVLNSALTNQGRSISIKICFVSQSISIGLLLLAAILTNCNVVEHELVQKHGAKHLLHKVVCLCVSIKLIIYRLVPRQLYSESTTMKHENVRMVLCVLILSAVLGALLTYMDDAELLHHTPARYYPRHRRPSKRRKRDDSEAVSRYLSESEFRRAFRLSRTAFDKLLSLLLPALKRNELHAARSSSAQQARFRWDWNHWEHSW